MKKINNKVLIITLAVLVLAWAASRFFRAPALESNLRKELIGVDTAAVTEIRILPANARESVIKLLRSGKNWSVEKDQQKFDADASSVKNLLATMVRVDAERMVSRKKEKWETFNVGEKSTNVTVFYGADAKAKFHIGKSGFTPGTQGMYGGGAYTYVRLSDEEEVYVIDGFLESTFNRNFSDWRDRSFSRIPKDLVTKISFRYPADSGFVVTKRDSTWWVGAQQADKAKLENYLSQLASKSLNTFADGSVPSTSPDVSIVVEGAGGTLGTIDGWKSDASWTLRSSLHPEIYFSTAGPNAEKELLVGQRHFMK